MIERFIHAVRHRSAELEPPHRFDEHSKANPIRLVEKMNVVAVNVVAALHEQVCGGAVGPLDADVFDARAQGRVIQR